MDQFSVEDILRKLHIEPMLLDLNIRLDKPVFSGGPLEDDRGVISYTLQSSLSSSISSISSDVMVTTSKDILEMLGGRQRSLEKRWLLYGIPVGNKDN